MVGAGRGRRGRTVRGPVIPGAPARLPVVGTCPPAGRRTPCPSGAACWTDLFTADPDRATEFYGALFGWVADAPAEEFGGYVNFRKDGALIAGMMCNDGSAGQPDGWTTYLSVPDAKATTEAAA